MTLKLIECENCSKDFYKAEGQIKRTKHNFCCKECFKVYRRNNPKKFQLDTKQSRSHLNMLLKYAEERNVLKK